MKSQYKHLIQVVLFGVLLFAMSIFCLLKPADIVSLSERRPLEQMPLCTIDTIKDGTFMKKFDRYGADQFPFRESFRKLHAATVTNIFQQRDMEGLYQDGAQLIAMEYPLNQKSLNHATKVFQTIYDKYLQESDCNLYLSIIPDKSYFLQKRSRYLTLNYDELIHNIVQANPQFQYIDITSLLQLDDYYTTDPHWKQEALLPVAQKIAEEMNSTLSTNYKENLSKEPFWGTYAGQAAKSLPPDHIRYLTNAELESLEIFDHQNNCKIPVYNHNKLSGRDPYEFFLSGPLSLITIENPNAESSKELIVFRDSFASPLAPLLASGYKKITLVDIRYLPSPSLQKYIQFQNQDVLFLYSTSVLNHSKTLK